MLYGVPRVPGALETAIGVESCQHSSVDLPCAAEIAVKLRYVGVAKVLLKTCTIKRMKTYGRFIFNFNAFLAKCRC